MTAMDPRRGGRGNDTTQTIQAAIDACAAKGAVMADERYCCKDNVRAPAGGFLAVSKD
jgi:hypothetical protein